MLIFKVKQNHKPVVVPQCCHAPAINIKPAPIAMAYKVTTGQRGETGETGPQGPQGEQGPQGLRGDSYFYLKIEDGNLYAYTASDDTVSENPFEYDEETGDLWYYIDEEQT